MAARRPIASMDLAPISRAGERMGEAIANAGTVTGNAMIRGNVAEAEGDKIAGVAIGKGVAAFGEGVQDVAKGYMAYQRKVEDQALATGQSAKQVGYAELDKKYENDKDYSTLEERYSKDLQTLNAGIEKTLGTPELQERYRNWSAPRDAYAIGGARSQARKTQTDVTGARRLENQQTLENNALNSADPVRRTDVIDTVNNQIQADYDLGLMTATQAQRERQSFATRYAAKSIGMMPDEEQVRLLSGKPQPNTIVALIPPDDRVQMLDNAKLRIERANNKESVLRSEQYERIILDAKVGIGKLPDRSLIEQDDTLGIARKNAVLRQYDAAAGDVATLHRVAAKFADPNGGPFNPFDKTEAGAVDTLFKWYGGDGPALQKVIDRTGMVPASFTTSLRADLISNDPKRVASALQVTSNVIGRNPNAFAGQTGAKEFDNAVVEFSHNVNELGMTADQAAKKYIEAQTPEYQARVKARIKNEDLNEIVKKQLSVDDARKAFDTSWWPGKPQLGHGPRERQAMYADYEQAFRDAYSDNGDVGKSKALAADKMKKTWGVTNVNGSEVIMRFPPERAPAFNGIDNLPERFSSQAIRAIRDESGQTVDRSQLRIDVVPNGRTAQAYWSGQSPPYMLTWQDKDGVLHMLNPGRAFVFDPKLARDEQSALNERKFTAEREYRDVARQPQPQLMTKERKGKDRRQGPTGTRLPE